MSVWKISTAAMVLGGSVLLAGCQSAPMPVASNFAYTEQHKLRAAGHWNLLASDVVQQTLAMLRAQGIGPTASVYVMPALQPSTFDQGFREFVMTQLVQQQVPVQSQRQQADIVLSYHTHTVVHRGPLPQFAPGHFSLLSAGLLAAYGLRNVDLDAKMVAQVGMGGLLDARESRHNGGPTHTEIILTTSALQGERYVARKTDAYYINDVDAGLFSAAAARSGAYAPIPLKVVTQ